MQIPLQFRWHFVVTSQTPRISKVNLLLFSVGELQCCYFAIVSSWIEKHREHSHNDLFKSDEFLCQFEVRIANS